MSHPSEADAKKKALKEHGNLHAHPNRVTDKLFMEKQFFDPHDLVRSSTRCSDECGSTASPFRARLTPLVCVGPPPTRHSNPKQNVDMRFDM